MMIYYYFSIKFKLFIIKLMYRIQSKDGRLIMREIIKRKLIIEQNKLRKQAFSYIIAEFDKLDNKS